MTSQTPQITPKALHTLMGNSQRLDGGSMFGNAPRVVWEKWMPADEAHRISLACRALLVRENAVGDIPGRNILIEAGIGAFFSPEMKKRFGVVEEEHRLLVSLAQHGLTHEDIDVVVLSHLHFDHAGGILTAYEEGKEPELLFPKAKFVISKEAWHRAKYPHLRDKASFIPGLTDLLWATGRVELVSGDASRALGEGYRFHRSHGHTPGLLLTEVFTESGSVIFASDLIPASSWVHLPITMGYDRFAEMLIDEKAGLLEHVVASGAQLCFTHDPEIALANVSQDEKGKFIVANPVASL